MIVNRQQNYIKKMTKMTKMCVQKTTINKLSAMSFRIMTKMTKVVTQTKTKKCQPAASDTSDLIKTECVTDSGLACQKKSTEHKKYKKEKKN